MKKAVVPACATSDWSPTVNAMLPSRMWEKLIFVLVKVQGYADARAHSSAPPA